MTGSLRTPDPWEALIDPATLDAAPIAVRDHRCEAPGPIVVAGAAGGSGVSTVASGCALALAAAGVTVSLVDGDFDRGGLGTAWGIPEGRTLDDLVEVADDPRAEHLAMIGMSHESGVRVFVSPARLGAEAAWGGGRLGRLIDRMCEAGAVIVDAGALRGDVGGQLVARAGRLIVVTPATVTAATAVRRVAAAVSAARPTLVPELVVNRPHRQRALSTRGAARIAGQAVQANLPYAERDAADCGAGRPVTRRRSPFRDRLEALVHSAEAGT